MIERYSRQKMAAVWSAETKFQTWLDMELAACWAHMKLGNITEDVYNDIQSKAKFDINRINEIEAEIHHDVIAFTTSVAEFVGPNSRYIHMGLTSSDVVDTAFSLQIQKAGTILKEGLESLMAVIRKQAQTHKYTLCMGRTHGVHAEPTTFGLKLTVWYDEMSRNMRRLEQAIETCRVGLVSGAVGNFAHMPPELEQYVCDQLGLKPAPASTQTLQRDRHAEFLTTLAVIAGTLEKIAVEIRGLQKTEFNEVQEPFSKDQKGSSAMPHKRNPILSERVTGIARVIRGYAITAMENQALWHERDISHSSAERIIFPDATIVLDYAISIMTKILTGLVVNEKQMLANIQKSYNVFFSQQILLKMVQKGMLREEAYRIVQRCAHDAFDHQELFDKKIRQDATIMKMFTTQELDEVFSLDTYKRSVDVIYNRVYPQQGQGTLG